MRGCQKRKKKLTASASSGLRLDPCPEAAGRKLCIDSCGEGVSRHSRVAAIGESEEMGKAKRSEEESGHASQSRRSRGRESTQASNSPKPIKSTTTKKSTQPQENQHPPTKHNPRRMPPRNVHNQMPQLLDRRLRFDAAFVAAVVRVVRDVEVGEEDGLGGVLVICRWRLAGGRGKGRQLGIKEEDGSWG